MQTIRLPTFPSVPTTGVAMLKWPGSDVRGKCVHALRFKLGGTYTKGTHITKVAVRSGSKTLIDNVSGQQLQDINDTWGRGDKTGYLYLWLADSTAQGLKSRIFGGLDGDIYPDDIDIEITNSGATAPTLQADALIGPPKAAYGSLLTDQERRAVRLYARSQNQYTGAVAEATGTVNFVPGSLIAAVHNIHTNLTQFSVTKGGVPLLDKVANADNDADLADFGRVQQSGFFSWLPMKSGDLADAVVTLREDQTPWPFRFLFTTSGTDTVTSVAEIFAPDRALAP